MQERVIYLGRCSCLWLPATNQAAENRVVCFIIDKWKPTGRMDCSSHTPGRGSAIFPAPPIHSDPLENISSDWELSAVKRLLSSRHRCPPIIDTSVTHIVHGGPRQSESDPAAETRLTGCLEENQSLKTNSAKTTGDKSDPSFIIE